MSALLFAKEWQSITKGQTIVKIQGITKSYKKKSVLKGINLTAGVGQCVGILGGNGSGKSTLLSILAGVNRADSGAFFWEEKDLLTEEALREEIVGYVPQGNPLMEELTAWDNLRLWYDKTDLKRELEGGVLTMLGINDFIKTPVYQMSGGMKKRLSIGCAVASNPKVLLLDEPSAALDLVCKARIGNYLEQFKAKGGIILLATHDVQELELCDSLYILKEGILTPYQYDGDVYHLVGKL